MSNANPTPEPLAPRARALSDRVEQQIGQPAALLVPAGVRSVVRELADLVVTLAAHIDHLNDRSRP